jgi:hypothetical protein
MMPGNKNIMQNNDKQSEIHTNLDDHIHNKRVCCVSIVGKGVLYRHRNMIKGNFATKKHTLYRYKYRYGQNITMKPTVCIKTTRPISSVSAPAIPDASHSHQDGVLILLNH